MGPRTPHSVVMEARKCLSSWVALRMFTVMSNWAGDEGAGA